MTVPPTTAHGRPSRISRPAAGALATVLALMVVSSVAHLWSLHRDLPLTDPDESTFVIPAVHMAASGDLNPHWFGHPGSTVIYPLAGLFHTWDALTGGPILASNPALTAQLERAPTTFYVIGRLWTIALSVGALPLLFLVGRRAFNTRVALIATAIWAGLALPVHYGRVVRTDSAGLFFGLLALYLCLRLLDEPRLRWSVLAGLTVGVAIASRYFMVALLPVLVAAAVLPHRRDLPRAVRSAGVALAGAVGGFAVTTPFFFLDWSTALDTLRVEESGTPGARSHSPLGNLYFYLRAGIPAVHDMATRRARHCRRHTRPPATAAPPALTGSVRRRLSCGDLSVWTAPAALAHSTPARCSFSSPPSASTPLDVRSPC